MRSLTLTMIVLSLGTTANAANAARTDVDAAYERAFRSAANAERKGDLKNAAALLEQGTRAFPQDYAIAEALGAARLRAQDNDGAEAAYRLALSIAPAADSSRLGLVAALVAQGRCTAATEATARLSEGPWYEAGVQTLAPCTPRPFSLALTATANAYAFPDHPWKSSAAGGTATALAAISDRWIFGGAYRYTEVNTIATSSQGAFSQNEGYADVGFNSESFGVLLHGALVEDGTGTLGTSKHAGFTLRYSPLGDLILNGSASVYADKDVFRMAPEWRLNVAGPFYLQPGIALQEASGTAYATGTLSGALAWPRFSVALGGKYGKEFRPAYLDAHVVYDITENVLYGGWASARARLFGPISVTAAYAFDRLERNDSLSPSQSNSHAFSLGPSFEF